jgi:hypothetical protein
MTEAAFDLLGVVPDVQKAPKKKLAGRYAYPAPPGTGPEGKRCRDCAFYVRVNGGSRDYPKCEKNHARWGHTCSTDINSRMPACRLFEAA